LVVEACVVAQMLALLSEPFPQHPEAILETGRNFGWHRTLAGKHRPTDVYAGRTHGRGISCELKTCAAFQHDFAECATTAVQTS
jgi:hypothetical protein